MQPDPSPQADLPGRIAAVTNQVAEVAATAGRDPASVRAVAVTKGFGPDVCRAALAAGCRRLGENRVAEAEGKARELQSTSGWEWHFIGHVQTNKAGRVSAFADWLHSVDSLRLVTALERRRSPGIPLQVLVQVKLTGEAAKTGCLAAEVPELVERLLASERLRVRGLMTMAPLGGDLAAARRAFRELRQLRDALAERYPDATLGELSMGMSGDWRVAIEEGATLLRLGTAFFGPRPPGR